MKIGLRIILGIFTGTILGLILPYAIAFLNLFPYLKGDTPYETVMTYMLFSGILGAAIGGIAAYRTALKDSVSK